MILPLGQATGPLSPANQRCLDYGLLAHFPLDEYSANFAINRVSGLGAAVVGTELTGRGSHTSRQFNGNYDAISQPIAVSGYPLSLSAWVRYDANISAGFALSDASAAANILFLGVGHVREAGVWGWRYIARVENAAYEAVAIAAPDTPTAGTWRHVAFVAVSAAAWRLYLDGALAVGPLAGASLPTVNMLGVGVIVHAYSDYDGGNKTYLGGGLSDVRVYARALSDAEVAALYGATL